MAAPPRGDRPPAVADRPISGSPRARRHPRAQVARRAFAVVAVIAVTLLVTTSPAVGHSELLASSPADGTVLPTAPTAITLTFSEDVIAAGSSMVATGPAGRVALGPTQVAGPRVSASWPQGQDGGRYSVSYRVVSADGHPITGTLSFSYAGASSSPASSSAASPAASPPAASAAPAVSPAASGDGGAGTTALVVGGLALLALVAVVAVSLARRRT